MHILHLTHTDIESDSRILKEMNALSAAGYKISGLGVSLDKGSKKTELSFEANINNINLHSRKMTFFPKTLRHVVTLLELFGKMFPRVFRERPNVIHCHDILVLPIGCFVKWLTGAKLVYDAHELESDRNGLTWLQGRLTLWIEKMLWGFIDALIVVSPSIERWYQENVGPKKSMVIFNSPYIAKGVKHNADYLRKKFSIPVESKIFIYVGKLSPGRGIDLLSHVFTDAKISAHIVFLGSGKLSFDLKRLADQHSNIHMHDIVIHSEVVPIVRSADYGLCLVQNVSLSDYYSLPNKLFEYCFAGVPVLASDFPDVRALIKQYKIGVCCKLEINEICNAVLMLERKKNARDFEDLTPLSWEAQEKKLVFLYQQIGFDQ